MSEELCERFFNTPMSDWIVQEANGLDGDAVGFWGIVAIGRDGFGLEGEALVSFLRRSLSEILSRGAVPVYGGGLDGPGWITQPQYGSTSDEIISNVIAEWQASGGGEGDPGGVWFALREYAWPPRE